jgi:hypothetical protein
MDLMTMRALTAQTVFTLPVDYSRTLSDLILVGHFDGVHNNITEHDKYTEEGVWNPFGDKVKLPKTVNFELFQGGDENWVTDGMKRAGCRPADAKELLAFAEKNPDLQRKVQIVALRSRVTPEGDGHFIAYLTGDSKKRDLTFFVFGKHGCHSWPECFCLAVRE